MMTEIVWGWLTSVDGQVNYYHVNFSDRLLNIAAYNFINPGAAVLVNVGGTFLTGLEASYLFEKPLSFGHVDSIKLSANVTNLTGIRGVTTAVVTSNSLGYQAYPIAPRMFFVTVSAKLD